MDFVILKGPARKSEKELLSAKETVQKGMRFRL